MLLQAPGLFLIHPLAQVAQLRQQRLIIGIRCHCLTEGAETKQQIPFGTTPLQHLLQHREPGGDSAVLPDQLHPQPRRATPFPIPEGLLAGQHLQQR